LEEKGAVRAAADFRLRCIRRGSRATVEAFRKRVSRKEVEKDSASRSPLWSLLSAHLPLAWSLLRHPRAVAAVMKREARNTPLDLWFSPPRRAAGSNL